MKLIDIESFLDEKENIMGLEVMQEAIKLMEAEGMKPSTLSFMGKSQDIKS